MKKTKWNWGTGIVIALFSFMSFILYFVITMSTNKKYSHDLVSEDYYAKEMAYQNEINAETNLQHLSVKINSKKTPKGWLLTFPQEFDPSKIKGKVVFYRPSNQNLDFELPLVISNSNFLVPEKQLLDGRWNITLEWTYNDKPFLFKEKIVY